MNIAKLLLRRRTKITDINTDCLEHIFKYLTLSDLLNVSDASKYFKDAADFAFTAKYGKKAVTIGKIRTRLASMRNSCLEIDDLKTSLQLLRCFGHLIRDLKINVDFRFVIDMNDVMFDAQSVRLLIDYVGIYGSNSLTSLTIRNATVQLLNLLKGPFLNMEKVEINTWCLESKLEKSWFHKLFPNIKCLKCKSVCGRVIYYECIENEFKSLERLDISYVSFQCKNLSNLYLNTNEECAAHNTNVKAALQLNPQLRTLSLPFISDFTILQHISEHKQQLESLSFQYASKDPLSFDDQVVHFKSIKALKMCFCNSNPRSDVKLMQKIPLSFDSLEELTFQTCYDYSDEFFNFISNNQSIRKLNLRSCGILINTQRCSVNRQKLLRALPLLKELHLMCCYISVDEVLAFATSFKSLEKFKFNLYPLENDSKLLKRLSPEWSSSFSELGSLVTLERKQR